MKQSVLTLVVILCLLVSSLCAPITATAVVSEASTGTRAIYPIANTRIIHCYSVSDAVAYARLYATNPNPDYSYYDGIGGDCANFVSQCLYAGGLKKTTANETTSPWDEGEYIWKSASNLRKFLKTVSYGTATDFTDIEEQESQILAQLRKGDVIFYRWDWYENIESEEYTYHHAAICTGIVNGVPQIAHHSHGTELTDWNIEPEHTAKLSVVRVTRYGDVDADEDITTTDGRLILQHYTGKYTIPAAYQPLADVDYDGEITSTDARLVQSAAIGSL